MAVRKPSVSVVRRRRGAPNRRRNASNPYFGKRHRQPAAWADLGKLLVLVGVPLVILTGIGYLIWGPTFRVSEISIEGATAATAGRIEKIVREEVERTRLYPSSNVFFVDKDSLTARIGDAFFLESLEISKKLPGEIRLQVEEKQVQAALLANGQFLGLDRSGFLVRELTVAEISSLGSLPPEYGQALSPELGAETAIISKQDLLAAGLEVPPEERVRSIMPVITLGYMPDDVGILDIGGQPIEIGVMTLILQAFRGLDDVVGEPVLRFVSRAPQSGSMEAVTDSGWRCYFSSSQPFIDQANKLMLILRDKVGERRSDLEYVDLRYGERIFFKFKDDPATPEGTEPPE